MKKIKKLVLKIPIDDRYAGVLNKCERFELVQIHRLDGDALLTTQIFRFKDINGHPRDLVGSFGIEFIEVLAEDKGKREFTCFAKTRWPEEIKVFFQDPDMILCLPLVVEDNAILISFMTDNDKLDSIFESLKRYKDPVKVLSISTVLTPNTDNIFQLLTERQRQIVYYAVEKGYYEIPRKINTTDLAEKFDISQSALSEHLRKIERIIFHSLFK